MSPLNHSLLHISLESCSSFLWESSQVRRSPMKIIARTWTGQQCTKNSWCYTTYIRFFFIIFGPRLWLRYLWLIGKVSWFSNQTFRSKFVKNSERNSVVVIRCFKNINSIPSLLKHLNHSPFELLSKQNKTQSSSRT